MFEQWMLHILARQERGEAMTPARMLALAPHHLYPGAVARCGTWRGVLVRLYPR